MKNGRYFSIVIAVTFLMLASLACYFGNPPVPTPIPPTNPPPISVDTATPIPTLPPAPTVTEIPPTPASVGDAVRSKSFEVTVIIARELARVYMGNYYYYPKADQIYVEVVVKVSNLTGSKARVPWENVYVTEDTGDKWYPTWGGYKATSSGHTIDGSTVGVNEIVDGKAVLEFEEDAFLRLIWLLTRKDTTIITFGFDDSPSVEIVIQ